MFRKETSSFVKQHRDGKHIRSILCALHTFWAIFGEVTTFVSSFKAYFCDGILFVLIIGLIRMYFIGTVPMSYYWASTIPFLDFIPNVPLLFVEQRCYVNRPRGRGLHNITMIHVVVLYY